MTQPSSISILEPGSPNYEQAEALIEYHTDETRRIDYDELASAYNKAQVGTVLILEETSSHKTANVYTVLKGRGLEPRVDVLVTKPIQRSDRSSIPPADRSIFIKKMTAAAMHVLRNK